MNIVFILILAVIFLGGLGCGAAIWFALRHKQAVKSQEPTKETTKRIGVTFRWRYICVPLAIFLLSIILSALFYNQLPVEVGYHFKADGTPDRWFSREMAMVWMLAPQFLLTLLAGILTWGITKLNILSGQIEGLWMKPQTLLFLMGNIVALPQIVLGFAMLDIFSYNSYQIHIMPTWAFLLILGLVTVALGLLLVFIVSRARRQVISQSKD